MVCQLSMFKLEACMPLYISLFGQGHILLKVVDTDQRAAKYINDNSPVDHFESYIRMLLCSSSTLACQLSLPTCFLLAQFSSTLAFNSALDTRLYKTMPRHVFSVICNYFNKALWWLILFILLLTMLSHLNDLDEFRFGQRVNWKHLSMSCVLYLNGRKIQL